MISPSDLVGCRFRAVQHEAYPEVPPTEAAQARLNRVEAARAVVFASLPTRPATGDRGYFRRGDAGGSFFDTLEAIAAGDTLITDARLEIGDLCVDVDMLVAMGGGYLPVIISNHRAARPAPGKKAQFLSVPRLGLGQVLTGEYRIRHHALDSYRLAIAGRALDDMDLSCGFGARIGQDRTRAFLEPLGPLDESLARALAVPVPDGPRRVKECDSCRFWPLCSRELEAADDISLLLPGDRARTYRERGITTVQGLIDADLGEASQLAEAYRSGSVLVPRGPVTAPRFDVELFIDMEAYLDQGVYLWGVFDGSSYHAFTAWSLEDEGDAFRAFWSYVTSVRDSASSFGAYCYSNHGENLWLRRSAARFLDEKGQQEVEEFINAPYWIDVFRLVKSQFIGPFGLGLKTVAPEAGFNYTGDVDGEASVNLFLAGAREELLQYNEDDCRATATVLDYLTSSFPASSPK
ncbi:TM0106 family RecB-like putative nuclease [Corynebacterium sp. H130]|uniref:TM0106 family RecB-like putative nuclease n=1 Tax=Corynebacterium sp. H130 TaxID=3133444 RepID=UPI0030B22B7D